MCGIIGYIGKQKAVPILLEGLKRVEYRGYDSAGVLFFEKGKAVCLKAVGKIEELEKRVGGKDFLATVGIAHTRWATHGRPCEKNSHPHCDCSKKIWLVHNGIIENYAELKKILLKKGHKFSSETDSEVLAHLIEEFGKKNDFRSSVIETLKLVKGTYGIAVVNADEPDKIIIARMGSPLVLGIGENEYVVASDTSAIIRHTDKVIFLEDGEMAELKLGNYEIFSFKNKTLAKEISKLEWDMEKAQKDGFDHFMLKEIFQQPEAIENAIRGRLVVPEGKAKMGGLGSVAKELKKIKKIIIVSCGTSYNAGMVGKYMLEEYAGIAVQVEHSSEFRYRKTVLDENTAVLAISQSGETADTLAAIREAKNKGILTLGIVNTVGSTISRETSAGVYNHAGPEIGVASTKAFTSQLSILVLLTLMLGRQKDMSLVMVKKIAMEMNRIPEIITSVLKNSKEIKKIAKKYFKYNNFLYLGRKYNMPIAEEGALKIKEISYIHAEAYPSGEMKHGPIALIDENFPTIVVVPNDSVYEKNISGIQEIKARGGKIIAIATQGDKKIKGLVDDVIYIPKTLEMLTPLIAVIPLQFFAYYCGVLRGYDVDKPRNLAKSVTVE